MNPVATVLVVLLLVGGMLAMGTSTTPRELRALSRQPFALALALLVNLLVIPAMALVLLASCSQEYVTPPPPDAPVEGEYDAGLSEPVEDDYYPEVGDPLVDALHYDLTLAWDPEQRRLEGTEVLTFRATADAEEVPLELSEALAVSSVTLDDEDVAYSRGRGDFRRRASAALTLIRVAGIGRSSDALTLCGSPYCRYGGSHVDESH